MSEKQAIEVIKLVGREVKGSNLDQHIGKFIRFKVGKVGEGLVHKYGVIFQIIAIQTHWGYNKKGQYILSKVGFRVSEIGSGDSFGRPADIDDVEILEGITMKEVLESNKKAFKIINKELSKIKIVSNN